jgi:hypothetical protein
MGAWGLNFLESDYDYDLAGALAEEAGVKCLMFPENLSVTRDVLNNSVLKHMFDKRQKMRPQPKYEIVMLAVLAMKLGCTIDESHIKLVKRVYRRAEMEEEKLASMKQALSKYTNGTPHDFGDKGLLETMHSSLLADNKGEDRNDEGESSTGEKKRSDREKGNFDEQGAAEVIQTSKKLSKKKVHRSDEGAVLKGTKRSHSGVAAGEVEGIVREPRRIR